MRDFEKHINVPVLSNVEQVNANMLKAAALLQQTHGNAKRSTQTKVVKPSITRSWIDGIVEKTPLAFAAKLARSTALNMLKKLRVGYLVFMDDQGRTHVFGDPEERHLRARVHVVKPTFWLRVALFDHLGFGEAYMYGDVLVDDLGVLLKMFAQNRDAFADFKLLPSTLSDAISRVSFLSYLVTVPANTIYKAIQNISAHYDLGNDMFASFLDPTMTYSCPIWKMDRQPGEPVESLEEAQLTKLRTMIKKARITKSDHVLEIGSGWGSMAIECVKQTGCKFTTLTLSVEQKVLAERRIAQAGLSSHIQVVLSDYRAFADQHFSQPHAKPFDKLLSCEMLEAVGYEFLPTYFATVDRLIDKRHGIAVIQFISMPENRYEEYLRTTDFIQKHIFPGGHCPTVTAVVDAVTKGTNGELIVDDLENIGGHYARALRIWREEFVKNYDAVVEQADDFGKKVYDDVFKHFAYCEAGFASKMLGDYHMVLTRESDISTLAGIPM